MDAKVLLISSLSSHDLSSRVETRLLINALTAGELRRLVVSEVCHNLKAPSKYIVQG